MLNNEAQLLYRALCYEAGHSRRTQHILKVFALSKLLGETEKLSVEEQQILQAAAILHDIAIKYCKEHFDGDASQARQKQEAPHLVSQLSAILCSQNPAARTTTPRLRPTTRQRATTSDGSRSNCKLLRKPTQSGENTIYSVHLPLKSWERTSGTLFERGHKIGEIYEPDRTD